MTAVKREPNQDDIAAFVGALFQHADGDPARLRQIQAARGYKPGWVRYAVREAAEKQQTKIRGAAV